MDNMYTGMKKLVILDFDGTVIDTITDVALCFNESLRCNGFPDHPIAAFDRFVGGNLETVISRMLPQDQVTEENISKVKTLYRQLYLQSDKPNTKPYPGMMEMLQELKARRFFLAVNSNKGQALLDDMVAKIFPDNFFDAVVGYDESRPSKPNPLGVQMILQSCGLEPEQAVYVGDGKSDIDTAANAGIPCVFVTWGQGKPEDRYDKRVAHVAENSKTLYDLLLQWPW